MANDLKALVTLLCGGTITVNKYINSTDNQAGAGWEFTIAGEIGETDENGQTTPVDVDPGTYSITENTVLDGYTFTSAICYKDGQPVGTPVGMGVTDIVVGADDLIICDVVNTRVEICNGEDDDGDGQIDE